MRSSFRSTLQKKADENVAEFQPIVAMTLPGCDTGETNVQDSFVGGVDTINRGLLKSVELLHVDWHCDGLC